MRQVILRYTWAAVLNTDQNSALRYGKMNSHLTTSRGMINGIANQIIQDPFT